MSTIDAALAGSWQDFYLLLRRTSRHFLLSWRRFPAG